MRADLQAVGLVRSRAFGSKLSFWLLVAGYDHESRSWNDRIYLVYAAVFFAIWIFMVLTLLSSLAVQILRLIDPAAPVMAAVGLGSLLFLGAFVFELYQATRSSPLVFSDEDAQLICMTPVDRRVVALGWLLTAWLESRWIFWAAAIVLGYAVFESRVEPSAAVLPGYLAAGLRMFSLAVPLTLGLKAAAWAPGVLRLRGSRARPGLRLLAPAMLVLVGIVYALGGTPGLLTWLWPVTLPVQAGLGLASWNFGLAVASALILVGLLLLWLAAPGMSLARAAQESRFQYAMSAAMTTMSLDLVRELAQQQRLKASNKPPGSITRLAAFRGRRALLWKSALQAVRRARPQEALPWLAQAVLLLSIIWFEDWATRGLLMLVWVLLAAQIMVAPLRLTLQRWWLLHQVPFRAEEQVAGSLILAVLGLWLTGGLALLAATVLNRPIPGFVVGMYLLAVPGVGLAGAVDILRRCRTSALLTSAVPDLSLLSLLMGAAFLGLLVGGTAWMQTNTLANPGLVMAFPALWIIYLLLRWSGYLLRRVR